MDKPELRVGGFTPLTSIDYPGELAAVVFCQGCPWHCRYCHNGELLAADGGEPIPWQQVYDRLERRRGLLDAVVFSGGEPTLQRGLGQALAQVRTLGYRTGLHTAGIYPDRLRTLLPLLDWVGLDIKAPEADYPAITGVPGSGTAAWDSARLLIGSGLDHEIRLTLHPTLVTPAQAQTILERLTALGAPRVVLQACDTSHALDPQLHSLPAVGLAAYAHLPSSYPAAAIRPPLAA